MPKKALAQQLVELHRELAAADALDPELRDLLKDVAADIEQLLGEEAPAEQPSADTELTARVRRATVDFEADHPRLAGILGDVADTLSKLGI